MIFTERIEKLLGANHIKEVIDEFLKFLSDVPQSDKDARSDANQLRGQIIVLSGRFTELNTKVNTNTIDPGTANQEKAMLINSIVQILNQLPSSYPDLNRYLEEKNEDDEWKDAQEKNKIESYQVYFSKYPNGKYKAATIKLIAELEDVKSTQDREIKRLAQLEKERRENDKAAGEAQRARATTPQSAYQSAASVSTQPATSRKGLYLILGAVLGIVLIIVVATTMSSKNEPAQTTSSNEEPATTTPSDNDLVTPDDEPVTPLKSDDPVVPAVETEKNTGPSEAVKAELISAIRLADNAEIKAFYSLDPTPLYKSYGGEALKSLLSEIENLTNQGVASSNKLERQDFQSFTVSNDGQEATVKLVEVWSNEYINIATQQCVSRRLSTKLPQTQYLKKTDYGWIITTVVMGKLVSQDPVPCN